MSRPSVQARDNNVYVISGELNMQTVPDVLTDVENILDASQGDICFDLGEVTRSDSAGLALLVEWMQQAGQRQRKLSFSHLPEQLLAIARVSGLEELLPLV